MDSIDIRRIYNASFWYRFGEIYRGIRVNYRQTSEGYAKLARAFVYGSELLQGEVIDEDRK